MFENFTNLMGHEAQTVTIAVADTAYSTGPLEPGTYAVWSDVDAYIKVSKTAADAETVTTSTGFPVAAGLNTLPVMIQDFCHVGVISGSTGTLSIHKV